jgi:hypothetical protein
MSKDCDSCELKIKGKSRAEIAHLMSIHKKLHHGARS